MDTLVHLQRIVPREAVPAAVMGTGKGLVSAMDLLVFFQMVTFSEGFATAGVRADKGPFSGVHQCVRVQGCRLGKGTCTALVRTDTGPLSRMNPAVYLQAVTAREAAPATPGRADKRPGFSRKARLSLPHPRVHKSAATAGTGAGQGALARRAGPGAVSRSGHGLLSRDTLMATGKAACRLLPMASRARGRRRFHGCAREA